MTRYCVIGAGAAGISALEQLRQAGHDVDCYEKSDRVGGHWHTDYDMLHLITSRDMTHFEGFPMPADYPHFPRRDQVREYIESYARPRATTTSSGSTPPSPRWCRSRPTGRWDRPGGR